MRTLILCGRRLGDETTRLAAQCARGSGGEGRDDVAEVDARDGEPSSIVGGGAASIGAQTVSNAGLSAALLAESDLPNFQQIGETSQTNSNSVNGVSVATVRMRRGFVADGGATLSAELLQFSADGGFINFDPGTAGEALLRGAAGVGNAAFSDFALTGALGLGESDQSATWTALSPQGDRWTYSADVFRRGHVLATVVYATPGLSADLATLTAYAQLQDAKLSAAGLG